MSDKALLLDALNKYVKPITSAVAVKVLLDENEELPPKTRTPKSMGQEKLLICQAIGLARRLGWTFVLKNEDHGCAPSAIVMGVKEKPEFQVQGNIVYPMYAATPEAGARTEELVPQFPLGKMKGLLFAPLEKADFEPDVVVVYGLPAQIVRLVQGALFEEGGTISSNFGGRCACGSYIVVPYLTGECKVIVQGGGERVFAGCGDEEICFAIPGSKMGTVARGLAGTHAGGAARIPTPAWQMMSKPAMPAKYKPLEDYLWGE